MPRYLNATEAISGKSGNRKGKSSSAGRSGRNKEINNNGRPKSAGAAAAEGASADPLANVDALSEISECSRMSFRDDFDDDVASVTTESAFGASGEMTEDQWVVLEEKLKENVENATHKNSNIRTPALKFLVKTLAGHYIPDFLENQKVTIADCAERLLRKGTAADGQLILKLVSLLVIQLGRSAAGAVAGIVTNLKILVNDPALSGQFRAECASTLGICVALAEEEAQDIVGAADSLRTAWSHVKMHSPNADMVPFFCSAIVSWSFILLEAPTKNLEQALTAELPKVASYLESNHLEIKIAAGEALALLHELANEIYTDFRPPNHYHVLEQLESLSTESTKHYGKKDRKLQRASFREVFAAVKNNEAPKITVRFPPEVLTIDSWSSKLCYDVFCHVLSGGINIHLKENSILRDVFGLGPPLPAGLTFKRLSKAERQTIANTVSKARTLIRGKQRDKRLAVF